MKTWFIRIIINTSINNNKKNSKVILYEQVALENNLDNKVKDKKKKWI